MAEFLAAILLLVLGGTIAVVLRSKARPSQLAAQLGAIVGCVIGLAGAVRILVSAQPESVSAASFMPGGAIHLQIDALAAFFLLPVFGLSILTAIYGASYMSGRGERRGIAASWFYLNLLTAGMAGALLGFLRFNFPPARIYMGDGGAYFLGFQIGLFTIVNSQKGTILPALVAPLFVLALPIVKNGYDEVPTLAPMK